MGWVCQPCACAWLSRGYALLPRPSRLGRAFARVAQHHAPAIWACSPGRCRSGAPSDVGPRLARCAAAVGHLGNQHSGSPHLSGSSDCRVLDPLLRSSGHAPGIRSRHGPEAQGAPVPGSYVDYLAGPQCCDKRPGELPQLFVPTQRHLGTGLCRGDLERRTQRLPGAIELAPRHNILVPADRGGDATRR